MGRADVDAGRDAYRRRGWSEAYEALRNADRANSLAAEDLELLATSAYMLGLDDEYVDGLERAHRSHLDAGATTRAVRAAFWIGLAHMTHGEVGPARGWFARAERLLEHERVDCVERGYLAIPEILAGVIGGDDEAARSAASGAAAVGERFGDRDLVALAAHEQGHALVRLGRVDEGLRLLDETMVSVVAGELSPVTTGIVYCNTIAFCHSVFELRRARDWTVHLSRWCEEQPDMVAHTGVCLVHRAEIKELQGDWSDAMVEARRAGERFAGRSGNRRSLGRAIYVEAELRRLQGDLAAAEEAYRAASRHGYEPQPGLALLRLEQGKAKAAATAIRRVTGETSSRLERVALLPACVEILVAAGDLDGAAGACRELSEIAETQQSEAIGAMAARALGEVALARGDARSALVLLRDAARGWQALEAPYEAARARVSLAQACRALGDEDTAALELDAARDVFVQLGAARDAARAEALARVGAGSDDHGLTARELDVLRRVARGATNKAIAAELVLSQRTVDRHVSNIFAKLRVTSRAAATAFAYEHDLV